MGGALGTAIAAARPIALEIRSPFQAMRRYHVRRLISRAAAITLCVALALGAAAAPCAAEGATAATAGSKLTRLSPASRQLLAAAPKAATQDQPAGAPGTSGSFFKSTRGKVTLALMGAGVGFTVWSINHDRKPVKSPIR